MAAPVDITGQRFGKVVAIRPTSKRKPNGEIIWECNCDCGEVFFTGTGTLRYGSTKSCGCGRKEHLYKNPPQRTHGLSHTRLFRVWRGIIDRCYYPSHNRYHLYGGRGIKICDEWKEDFKAFSNWAESAGYDEDASRGECTIDRINNDGDYEPSNCRWVDMKTQANNRRERNV